MLDVPRVMPADTLHLDSIRLRGLLAMPVLRSLPYPLSTPSLSGGPSCERQRQMKTLPQLRWVVPVLVELTLIRKHLIE